MATKSILKTVNIKTKKGCLALINALENADGFKEKKVTISKKYKVASKEDIVKMFGEPAK